MGVAAKLDDLGKPAWIGVMVLAFVIFWPAGLAILAYLIWSGRMGCWKRSSWQDMSRARGRWHNTDSRTGRVRWESSGNSAFDEYRAETLRRLEDEQAEFLGFLERLRQAKDKAEFDQFMAERRAAPPRPDPEPPAGDRQDPPGGA
ncbi:MAG: DUF2852 domain-containing protein [Sneathiellaceae bacterium]